jgi:hypothetical protein
MPEGMRAVDQHGHAARVRHVGNLPYRQDVASDVHDVAHHQESRLVRDGVGVDLHDFVVRLRVARNRDDLVDGSVAARDEPEIRQHVPVILRGHHRFVARLPVETVHDGVEGLGRIAGDAQLVRRATRHHRELVAHCCLVRDLGHTHVVRALEVHLAYSRE